MYYSLCVIVVITGGCFGDCNASSTVPTSQSSTSKAISPHDVVWLWALWLARWYHGTPAERFDSLIWAHAWFPPFRCRSAVAVSPLPLRKLRKNSVSAVRNYVAYVKKFRCAVAVSINSVLTATATVAIRNGTAATVQRNGETATAERQRNGGNQALLIVTVVLWANDDDDDDDPTWATTYLSAWSRGSAYIAFWYDWAVSMIVDTLTPARRLAHLHSTCGQTQSSAWHISTNGTHW